MKITNMVFLLFFLMMKSKVRTRSPSFLDIIAGSAGGGAIILGLIILILVLIIRSVFLKQITCISSHQFSIML